ncbi:Transposon Ty3-I Gag-Pol polyprotein [Labeo rohita]|uniref:Gypsy retrotransposon integrase-like protein 1 n=1 Tax=Labeo rohita TaxID=84645 RepID=A0ABQ8LJI8_LABRO|nr:Transposon Ty3-I Gag-Pol polyprotein [Labeo rohita]
MLNYCVGRLFHHQPTHVSTALRSYLYTYLCACENAGFLVEISTPLLERSQINSVVNLLTRVMSGPEMVPADLEQLVGVIRQQAMEIMSVRQELVNFRTEITALRTETADHDDLAAAQAPPAEPIRQPPPASHPKISLPDKWDGSGTKCDVFLTNLSLVFEFQPSRYPTDRSRIALLTSLLTGQAAEWATAVLKADGDIAHSYPAFTTELRTVFQHPESEVEVDSRLYHLKQGSRSVSRYTTEFRTLVVQTTWSNSALRTAYYEGLSTRLKDELAVRELPDTLEGMIQLALRVDQWMNHTTKTVFRSLTGSTSYQRTPEPSASHAVAASPPPPPIASETHSTGAGREVQTLPRGPLCLLRLPGPPPSYLPSSDGKRTDQVKRGRSSSGPTAAKTCPESVTSRLLLQIETTAFVDSGAAGNFIDQAYAAHLGIVTEALSQPLKVTAIDDTPGSSLMTPSSPGRHTGSFIGATCQELCLWAKAGTCSGESGALDVDREAIPVQYRDLVEVFSRRSAARLPPHRPYDLAIDLVPGAVPPRGHLYSLSAKEQLVMEEYIAEGLRAGTIRPSSSPAAAGFFFVKKKDGGLRPCVNYRGLNQITVKNRHPLPLTNTTLDALSGGHFITKLDLRSAYNLVRIRKGDEWKTVFITPTGHYETLVMPFSLCNSPAAFQHFINDVLRDMLGRWCYAYLDDILIYSKTLEEHTQHVQAVLQRLLAHQLYCKLEKCAFHQHSTTFLGFIISAQGVAMDPQKLEAVLRLQHLSLLSQNHHAENSTSPRKPFKPFVVEVDASDVGVGAVLSQRGPDEKLHPCSSFSRKFNPTQQRYGVGDRELLAIKRALEEWRHWLQGGSEPFTVWTNHQNLTAGAVSLRQEVLQWGHDSTLAGHQGVQRTASFIGRAFWWRTLRKDVQEYVQACNICARSKNPNAPSTGELQPLPIPRPVHLVALSGLPSAKTTAELILEHVVRLHGFPQDIVSDRGPQFMAKFWQAFCRLVGTTSSLSSNFHPQTNGQTERANQQLERFLRCFASEHQRSWASYLIWAELSNNLHTSTATGLSPFEVCYGFQPPIFEHQEPEVEVPSAQQLVQDEPSGNPRPLHPGSSSHPGLPSSGILRSGSVWCWPWRGGYCHMHRITTALRSYLYTYLCACENAGFLVEISTPLLERSQINSVVNLLTHMYPRLNSPSRYTGTYPRSITSCLASVTKRGQTYRALLKCD